MSEEETGSAADRDGMSWLELWRSMAEAVPDTLLLVDRAGKILCVNRVPAGARADDILESSVVDLAVPGECGERLESIARVFEGASPRSLESRVVLPEVGERWFETCTAPLVVDNAIVAAVIVARDITEARSHEARVAESEAKYRTLMESAPEAMVVLDVDLGRIVEVNRNACTLFGLSADQLCETDLLTLSTSHQADGRSSDEAMRSYLDSTIAGAAPTFEWLHSTAAGRTVPCRVRLVGLPSAERRLVHGSITDMTLQRRFEHQLLQWQRMDAIGQLACGIAHDFMNILTVILASAQVITRVVNDSELRADALAIEAAAQRGAALASRLLTFARRQPLQTDGVVDMNQVVRDVTIMMSRVISRDITLVHALDGVPVTARIGRGQLEQVLMNLLINARDSIVGSGTITIHTSRGHDRGRCSLLRVADTGSGIDTSVQHRIFDPFFTTKQHEHSTGLGLSTARGIVNDAGGRIDVTSTVGHGSVFELFIPA